MDANTTDYPVPKSLDELVSMLHAELGNEGLDTLDEKRLAKIRFMMSSYQSNEEDWQRFCVFDPNKYTRNLVDDGNGKFNLLLLAWGEGQMSAIHDHAGSHCLMKILDGEIIETQYNWPDTKEEKALTVLKATTHKRDQITYINDSIGLHRVENPSHVKGAVSLHLYTPPYSECRTFNESSGQARASGKMTFYTVKGERVSHR